MRLSGWPYAEGKKSVIVCDVCDNDVTGPVMCVVTTERVLLELCSTCEKWTLSTWVIGRPAAARSDALKTGD